MIPPNGPQRDSQFSDLNFKLFDHSHCIIFSSLNTAHCLPESLLLASIAYFQRIKSTLKTDSQRKNRLISPVGSSQDTLNTEKWMTERGKIKICPNSIFNCCGEAHIRADLEKEKRWFVCTHADRIQTKGPQKKA